MKPAAPSHKRLKLNDGSPSNPDAARIRMQRSAFLSSLSRPVSPPLREIQSKGTLTAQADLTLEDLASAHAEVPNESVPVREVKNDNLSNSTLPRFISSPFRLTRSHDLPDSANIDTVTIRELLGNPLIKEAWIFNYCHDVDWTMQQFDPDIRDLVSVKIVHGFWKQEHGGKIAIDEACARYPNVKAIQAYLPDPFGTHHIKMIILLQHDDLAQVIIHTANMLAEDWGNTTQAAWCSPLLPVDKQNLAKTPDVGEIGGGERFKHDLLTYLRGYGRGKMDPLIHVLQEYDFSAVRGALIGSIPSKQQLSYASPTSNAWGHIGLKRALKTIRTTGVPLTAKATARPVIIAQISSIATFTKHWLTDTLFKALSPTTDPARLSIIFPTPEEVRTSLDGYGCGGSIHLKAATATHQKQIDFLRPHLCHWATPPGQEPAGLRDAMRGRAAPHIKTYMRLCASDANRDEGRQAPNIEWALLSSANLSMQAWGTAPRQPSKKEKEEEGLKGEIVHIQSYELGVLVWPALFADGKEAKMVPVFGTDMPRTDHEAETGAGRMLGKVESKRSEEAGVVVGMRMPYDLPLTPYAAGENPWSPGGRYGDPDTHGRVWPDSWQQH